MIRFLADEDFNGRIFRGLLLRKPALDLIHIQTARLDGINDDLVLEFAEETSRILVSHDGRTMPRHLRNRLVAGLHVPGVFIVDDYAPIGTCIEELLIIAECSMADEWRDQIYYLPWK